jgi:hypothetical protein
MTIFNRTLSDGVTVSDDSTPQEEPMRDFCWTGHVHFMARNIDEARALLARYFATDREDDTADRVFTSGQMTIGAAVIIHQPISNSETTH